MLSGVRIVPTPWHTLGHTVLVMGSARERAIYMGDAKLHENNFEHPERLVVAKPGHSVDCTTDGVGARRKSS